MSQQCNTCYYHIRQFKPIRPFLTDGAAKIVSQSIVFSRLDYCNSLLCNSSQSNLFKLQRVQNCLARVVTRVPRLGSITDAKKSLHWLPVLSRIDFKTALITYKAMTTGQPHYLAKRINRYANTRNLRSSSQNLLV